MLIGHDLQLLVFFVIFISWNYYNIIHLVLSCELLVQLPNDCGNHSHIICLVTEDISETKTSI